MFLIRFRLCIAFDDFSSFATAIRRNEIFNIAMCSKALKLMLS